MVLCQVMAELPSLIPTLIELGLNDADTLQEVQARQVMYGGDQQINLLELGFVSEADLLGALASLCSLPAAVPGSLNIDLPLTGELQLGGIAGVAGLAEDGSKVVYVDRIDEEVRARLAQLWTDGYQLRITTTLRLKEATHVFLGEKLPKRLALALGKPIASSYLPHKGELDTQVSRLPDVAPIGDLNPVWTLNLDTQLLQHSSAAREDLTQPSPEIELKESHQPVSATTKALLQASSNPMIETAPPPTGYEDIAAFSAAPSSRGGEQHASAEDSSYDLSDAILDLSAAESSDRIVDILVRFASSLFVYAAAFGLSSVEARGLRASGPASSTDNIKRITFPLDLPSAFQRAQSHKDGDILRLRASGVEGGVAKDLKRPVGMEVFLCPVIVQSRPVVLLWCDNGGANVAPESRQSFEQLMSHVARAFKRILVEKKRASRAPPALDMLSVLPRARASAAPPLDNSNLSATPSSPTSPSGPGSHSPSAHDLPASSPTRLGLTDNVPRALYQASPEHTQTQRNPAAPPQQGSIFPPDEPSAELVEDDDLLHEVASAKKRTLTRPSGTSDIPGSFPPEAPRTLKGFPHVGVPKIESLAPDAPVHERSSSLPPREPLLSRRIVPLKKPVHGTYTPSERPAAALDDAASQQHSPEPRHATKTSITPPAPSYQPPKFEVVTAPEALRRTTPNDTLLSRRAPLPDVADSDWESEIVPSTGSDIDAIVASDLKRPISFSDLVTELLNGNEGVLRQLMEGGETAVGALIAEFPGPVSEPQSASQKASECGPILAALVGLGGKSLPFVTVRTADENPRIRRWATFLLGELPGKESAHAIAARLLDGSIEVRRAALISARRVRRDALTRRTLRAQVEQICRDQSLDPEARCSAIEALADIREHEAIPVLLQLLEDFSSNVARSARWALSVLMRQDFGDDTEAWRQFWQEHRDEDRVEWLISSLDHEKRDIRRAAGDELRALCGNDFGYDEDQSQPDRRRAQADFRTWWNETGKANLH